MFPSNGDKGKAKMREFCGEASPAAGQGKANNAYLSHVQHVLNAAAPLKPFSYMSLLTASDDEDETDPLSSQRNQIDQIILLHNEKLRQELVGAVEKHQRGAEERAAKKHKERESALSARNAELERMAERYKAEAEHYKGQAERMHIKLKFLERANRALTERVQEANAFHHYMETAQEEAESSFPDPDRVGPIMLECKVCERQVATVMLWPCRHVCVCTRCDNATRICPVCCSVKNGSIEVHLPI